jgi:hypothetical protein
LNPIELCPGKAERSHHDIEQEPPRDQYSKHGYGARVSDVQKLPVQRALPP